MLMYPSDAGQTLKRFQWHKFFAQMQCAFVLRSPDRIFIQPFFRPEQFFDRIIKCVDSPATEGSPVNFPSVLLCKSGAELQTLTSDGTR